MLAAEGILRYQFLSAVSIRFICDFWSVLFYRATQKKRVGGDFFSHKSWSTFLSSENGFRGKKSKGFMFVRSFSTSSQRFNLSTEPSKMRVLITRTLGCAYLKHLAPFVSVENLFRRKAVLKKHQARLLLLLYLYCFTY